MSIDKMGQVIDFPTTKEDRLYRSTRQKFKTQLELWKSEKANEILFSHIDTNKLVENFANLAQRAYAKIAENKDEHFELFTANAENFLELVCDRFLKQPTESEKLLKGVCTNTEGFERRIREGELAALLNKLGKANKEGTEGKTGEVVQLKRKD